MAGLRWGPEIHGIGQDTETVLRRRCTDLCLGLADILEVPSAALFLAPGYSGLPFGGGGVCVTGMEAIGILDCRA